MTMQSPLSDLTIVIPIYNEAQALPGYLPELVETCKAKNWQVIFVNDGSKDESGEILQEVEQKDFIRVYHHKLNKGYGGALKTGILKADTPYVITMDGDGQHLLEDVEGIYHFTKENNADMVVGSRIPMQHANAYREVGKWLIRNFTKLLVTLPIKDLNSGFKIYQTELVKQYLSLCPNSMAFSDVITLLFLDQRHLVLEYPIKVQPRLAGVSTINTKTAFETVVEILSLVMLINPLRIFLPLSLLCVTAGVLWGIPIILMGRGVSVGAMLAIVLGVLFFFLGLIANQLSAMRLYLSSLGKNKETD